MSDTAQDHTHETRNDQAPGTKEVAPVIRMQLKDKEYRRLCEEARKRGCSPEELVVRCIQSLLDT